MSEVNRTPTKQFVEIGDNHHSGESVSDGEENLRSQLLDRTITSSQVDRRINAIVAPLSTGLEMLIQSVRVLRVKDSTRSTEGNATSERSRSSGQHSHNSCH